VIRAVAVVIQPTVMGASSTRTFLFVVIISGCVWGWGTKPGCWEQICVALLVDDRHGLLQFMTRRQTRSEKNMRRSAKRVG